MRCQNCGKKQPEGAKRCSYCHSKLKQEQKSSEKSGSQKRKIQPMDIVTLVFTAIIVGIMIYVICIRFIGDDSSGGTKATNAPGTSASPAPATPSMTETGITNGNSANHGLAAEIDGRVYYSNTVDGVTSLWVYADGVHKKLIDDHCMDINVITDPATYADLQDATGYTVFYLDGDQNICAIADGPIYKDGATPAPTATEKSDYVYPPEEESIEKITVAEGSYSNLIVDKEWIYYLDDSTGQIGRRSMLKDSVQEIGHGTYTGFTLYKDTIYAIGKSDSYVYALPDEPHTHATPTPLPTASAANGTHAPEATEIQQTAGSTGAQTEEGDQEEVCDQEVVLISSVVKIVTADSNWIYTVTSEGLYRYPLDGVGKEVLMKGNIQTVNVSGGMVYYVLDGKLYRASPEDFLMNTPRLIGDISCSAVNVTSEGVYCLNDEDHLLYKAELGKENEIGALAKITP